MMKTRARIAVLAAGAVAVTGGLSAAAFGQGGALFGPETTVERASDAGKSGSKDAARDAVDSERNDQSTPDAHGRDNSAKDGQSDDRRNGSQQNGEASKSKGTDDSGESANADAGDAQDAVVEPGTRFEAGDKIESPDGSYVMGQQPDGDFVLRDAHGQRLWSTQTYGHDGAYTDFLGDGNLVTYSEDGEPLFTSATKDSGAAALAVQNDGNIVIYDENEDAVWSTEEQEMKLRSGQRLHAQQSRISANGEYEFLQQKDGNVVMRKRDSGDVLWSSGTDGNPGAYTQMMPNGNLVTYTADGSESLFFTATSGNAGAELHVNNDGNAGIRATNGDSPWGTATTYDKVLPNQELRPGQDRQTDGYRLVQGQDGNLVLYTDGGKSIWSSGTKGNPGARTVLYDGNLMVVDENDNALWATDTAGSGAQQLVVQEDGNLVLYGAGNKVLWSSNTER